MTSGVADIAWLAGFWDADGSITIRKQSTWLIPAAICTSTNRELIDNVKRILDDNRLAYNVSYYDRGARTNAKPAWDVVIQGKGRVLPFLTLIEPFLVGKQEQLQVCKQHCLLPKGRNTVKTDLYWTLKEDINRLNARGRVR